MKLCNVIDTDAMYFL